jgi:hypothetical protein
MLSREIGNSASQFSLTEGQGSSRARPDSFAIFLRREAFAAPTASRCALTIRNCCQAEDTAEFGLLVPHTFPLGGTCVRTVLSTSLG